jgi:hypothetical protein
MEKTYLWVDAFFDNLISPYDKEIAERLKNRIGEMKDVYDEIEPQMSHYQI